MTIEEARSVVEKIRDVRADDEVAHGMEDELRAAVLRYISSGSATEAEARELSEIAMSTEEIDFCRWCA